MISKKIRTGNAETGNEGSSTCFRNECYGCTWSKHSCQDSVDWRGHYRRAGADSWHNDKTSCAPDVSEDCIETEEEMRRQAGRADPPAYSHYTRSNKHTPHTDSVAHPPHQYQSLIMQIKKLRIALADSPVPKGERRGFDAAIEHPYAAPRNAFLFKRVDRVYNTELRDWELVERTMNCQRAHDCAFRVHREYDASGKLEQTRVDINTGLLRTALGTIFRTCGYPTTEQDVHSIDPHLLFHFRAEIDAHIRRTQECKAKNKAALLDETSQCGLLLDFVGEEFAGLEGQLEAMLKRGVIHYDLVWTLFKPGTIAYTSTYQNKSDPRCFRVETVRQNDGWVVDGNYLDCDGERFSKRHHQAFIHAFKGCRKISNLTAYPLQYHQDPDTTRQNLVERGRKFVSLSGVNHCFHNGVAYQQTGNEVTRVNCNSRIMIDPVTFRRVNPNYHARLRADQDEMDGVANMGGSIGADRAGPAQDGNIKTRDVERNEQQCFKEEELLIASSVVLGFDLSEKCWLEFSLSDVHEIQWSENALSSVVIPNSTKQHLEALISDHLNDTSSKPKNISELERGGLNIVLYGPPGVGKTMTVAAMAEHLRRPLYRMETCDLGVDTFSVAQSLNEAAENTWSWGAIFLLDMADVYLGAREANDIHHNGVVSAVLRFLERHHHVLIMTTDKVESFDEAVQGHIHAGIRFESPSAQMRRMMWRQETSGAQPESLTARCNGEPASLLSKSDLDDLSRRALTGRQIASIVYASRNIALFDKKALTKTHIEHVLDIASSFEDDMRGGKGYREAMQHYT